LSAARPTNERKATAMTNLITGIIGILMIAIFMGFMLVWVKAPPLIIICLVVAALLIYDFYLSVSGKSA
jgi:hypothetical protein